MNSSKPLLALGVALATLLPFTEACAQNSEADLAKQLSNPVAAVISLPFQLNDDKDIGAARGGKRTTLNVQPVVPLELNAQWNLISRTIVPLVSQDEIFPGAGRQTGLGDVVQSFFLSPKAPTASGWIWGAGPVLLLPTGTDDLLKSKKWGAGPTAVLLRQEHGWTYGALANHIWSFAGDSSRPDINTTFVQPFIGYTTPQAWGFTVNTETSYNWEAKQATVPVNFIVSKVTKFGDQPVQFSGGVRRWLDGPEAGPHGWGLRFAVTFLFPK